MEEMFESVYSQSLTDGTGINYAKKDDGIESIFPAVYKNSQDLENVDYADVKSCELENFLTDLYKGTEIMTNHETGWQKWVKERNPEPDKLHNKFAQDEKNGIFHGHYVPGICEGN